MSFNINEWVELILRWVHVFAGILWVGTTYYFTWLDGRFGELEKLAAGLAEPKNTSSGMSPDKTVWMVHSGGFYSVEKQIVPAIMPEKLHWFRWEAFLTWLSGFLLLGLIYYHRGYLVPMEDAKMSSGAAIGLSLGMIVAGWLVYDLLWLFVPEKAGVIVSYALIVVVTWVSFHFFQERAACLQLGAMMGTIMTANVWMRILPAQRRMVAALSASQTPNQAEARRAKARSKHNTFMVVPVVILMLSNHYPGIYHWQIVCGLVLVGWIAAAIIRRA
jgi:uncharacterized membrane protein